MVASSLLTLLATIAGLILAWLVSDRYASSERAVTPMFVALSVLVLLAALDQLGGGVIQATIGWSIQQVRLVLLAGGVVLGLWLVYDQATDDDVTLKLGGK